MTLSVVKTNHLGFLLFSRLESSAADDSKFWKTFYICTFKFAGIICSVIFDQKYEINKLYKKCIYVKLDFQNVHLLVTAHLLVICLLQRESFLSSLWLVRSEPILTWVLSEPNSEFHSGLSFLNLISGFTTLNCFKFFTLNSVTTWGV